jgi:hypothetical protein
MFARWASGTVATALAAWMALFGSSCAGDLVAVGTGREAAYRHRVLGYRIAVPEDEEEGGWRRIDVEGAALAFRDGRGSTVSLLSRCRGSGADPRILARQLRIGLSKPILLESGPLEVDGEPGWFQVFDTESNEARVRVKTVTTRVDSCTIDFVLVAADSYPDVEARFDRWWQSFDRGAAAFDGSDQASSAAGQESAP